MCPTPARHTGMNMSCGTVNFTSVEKLRTLRIAWLHRKVMVESTVITLFGMQFLQQLSQLPSRPEESHPILFPIASPALLTIQSRPRLQVGESRKRDLHHAPCVHLPLFESLGLSSLSSQTVDSTITFLCNHAIRNVRSFSTEVHIFIPVCRAGVGHTIHSLSAISAAGGHTFRYKYRTDNACVLIPLYDGTNCESAAKHHCPLLTHRGARILKYEYIK